MQNDYSRVNAEAWNQRAYDAWVNRFGTPKEAAAKIVKDPEGRVVSICRYFGDVKGKKIANLLGSNGNKAVALALLGADVTVVDIAEENRAYAVELADEANAKIRYIVSDVLELPKEELTSDYDIVFAELGVIHYFMDLKPFMKVVKELLKIGGIFVLQDFHPVSTKLITSTGKKHRVTGDYFDTSVHETEVAYLKYVPGSEYFTKDEWDSFKKVKERKWTLGEVVTSIADEGLFIKRLDEEPNTKTDDKGIPKIFTIAAQKISLF